MNRVQGAIEAMKPRIEALDPVKRAALDASMALTFTEHFEYQNLQAQAHAMGKLTPDEAMTVYVALGEVGSRDNGNWAANTDLATKVIVTKLVGELLDARLATSRGGRRRTRRAAHIRLRVPSVLRFRGGRRSGRTSRLGPVLKIGRRR